MFVSEKQFKALEAKLETLMASISAASEEKEGDDYEALKARVDELEAKLKVMTDDSPEEEESEEDKAEKEKAKSAKAEAESKKEEARTQAIAMAAAKAAVTMLASVGHDPVNTDGKVSGLKSEMSLSDFNELSITDKNAYMKQGGKLKN